MCYRHGNRGTERSNNSPKFPQLVWKETRMQHQEIWPKSWLSFILHDSPYSQPAEYFYLLSSGERMTILAMANRVHHVCKLWLLGCGCLEHQLGKGPGSAGGGWLIMSAIQNKEVAAGTPYICCLWTILLKCFDLGLSSQVPLSRLPALSLP